MSRNGGYSEEFANDGACPGQTPANPSAMLTEKMVASFTGSALYIAAWQNGSYSGLVFSYRLAAAGAQALSAQMNSKTS